MADSRGLVFITGASSGIGEACAKIFAEHGFDLILAARRMERLEKIAAEFRNTYGITVHCFRLDVADRAQVGELIHRNERLFDGVSVLVNNAGLAKGFDLIQEGSLDDWDQMIDTNLKGFLYVTQALLPLFVKKKSGHVVNMGSVAGHLVYPKGSIYAATKHAVHALNQAMRLDLNGSGIRVTEISPGMVETEFSQVRFKGDQERACAVYAGLKPLSPRDVAEAVYWCVERPSHVNIQEVVMYPTDQASPTVVTRR